MAPGFEQHRHRRRLFADDVDAYDAGRPAYPEGVFEILADHCGVGLGTRALEIGPGTGQATGRLLEMGTSVTAVELGEPLAATLRSNHPEPALTVVVGPFEEVDLPSASFDLVAAATSFHWVPTEPGLRRSAEVLASGGWLALWWNHFGDPDRPDPFHEALVPLLEARVPSLLDVPGAGVPGAAHPYALDADARIAEIDQTGLFGPVRHEVIVWTGRHTARGIRALFASFSPWLALEADVREDLLDAMEQLALDEFGGLVERPYLTPVYVAERLDRRAS